ncbi:hypothetical protein JF55_01490 [Pseudomonas sp. 1-7]|nr:hypothetical protein JF55_01490 [Pseudomonas sp. 1-7]
MNDDIRGNWPIVMLVYQGAWRYWRVTMACLFAQVTQFTQVFARQRQKARCGPYVLLQRVALLVQRHDLAAAHVGLPGYASRPCKKLARWALC